MVLEVILLEILVVGGKTEEMLVGDIQAGEKKLLTCGGEGNNG
jgi:hypothetical protein